MYKHLRAGIGVITRLRKIVPGEDSAISSVRGAPLRLFWAERDRRIIPATELGHDCGVSSKGKRTLL